MFYFLTSVTWHLMSWVIIFVAIWADYSLLSPPPVRMNRMDRSFFFLSSGFGGRGFELWLRGVGSLRDEPIMVLVLRMGGAGGLSSTSPLSDIFSYAAVTPHLSKHSQRRRKNIFMTSLILSLLYQSISFSLVSVSLPAGT